jgi:hypothetical protein
MTSVSILTAVYRPDPAHLRACLASVAAQSASALEHVVVVDGPQPAEVDNVLADTPGLVVERLPDRVGIGAATAAGWARCRGDLVGFLDHDDELHEDAVRIMAATLDAHPEAAFAYSDHDIRRPDGARTEPFFKPRFDIERLRHHNYITHFVMARRPAVDEVGGITTDLDGAQDHDLLLRLAERWPNPVHVQQVLYHWRRHPASVADSPDAKPYAFDAGRAAVERHCSRTGVQADVKPGPSPGLTMVHRRVARTAVAVVMIDRGQARPRWGVVDDPLHVLTRSVERCVDVDATLIDAGSMTAAESLGAIAASAAGIVVFADRNLEIVEPRSLHALAAQLADPAVRMVGGMLHALDGTIRHAGYRLADEPAEALVGWPGAHPGPNNVVSVAHRVIGTCAIGAAMRAGDPLLASALADCRSTWPGLATGMQITAERGTVRWTPLSIMRWNEPPSAAPWTTGAPDIADPMAHPALAPGGDWLERPGFAGASPYVMVNGRRVYG